MGIRVPAAPPRSLCAGAAARAARLNSHRHGAPSCPSPPSGGEDTLNAAGMSAEWPEQYAALPAAFSVSSPATAERDSCGFGAVGVAPRRKSGAAHRPRGGGYAYPGYGSAADPPQPPPAKRREADLRRKRAMLTSLPSAFCVAWRLHFRGLHRKEQTQRSRALTTAHRCVWRFEEVLCGTMRTYCLFKELEGA